MIASDRAKFPCFLQVPVFLILLLSTLHILQLFVDALFLSLLVQVVKKSACCLPPAERGAEKRSKQSSRDPNNEYAGHHKRVSKLVTSFCDAEPEAAPELPECFFRNSLPLVIVGPILMEPPAQELS